MRLLYDQNLPRRLVQELSEYPESHHVLDLQLDTASDRAVWEYARDNGLAIASKDGDFSQLAFLHGAPPKVVWLRVGNATTGAIAELLRGSVPTIESFLADPDEALLVLP